MLDYCFWFYATPQELELKFHSYEVLDKYKQSIVHIIGAPLI